MKGMRVCTGHVGPLRSFVRCDGFRRGADLLVLCGSNESYGEYIWNSTKILSLTYTADSKFPSGSEWNEETTLNAPRTYQCHGSWSISTFRSLNLFSVFITTLTLICYRKNWRAQFVLLLPVSLQQTADKTSLTLFILDGSSSLLNVNSLSTMSCVYGKCCGRTITAMNSLSSSL